MRFVLLAEVFSFLAFGFSGFALGTFLLLGGSALQVELGHGLVEAGDGCGGGFELDSSGLIAFRPIGKFGIFLYTLITG